MNDTVRLGLIRANGAWRFRWIGVGVAWSVALLSAAGLQFFKDRYEASAKVHVNTQTVLKPLGRGNRRVCHRFFDSDGAFAPHPRILNPSVAEQRIRGA